MSSRLFLLALVLVLLVGGYPGVSAQQAAPAEAGNLFDGEWSLAMSSATAPGGVSVSAVSPYNSHHAVENLRFEVKNDGTFEWLARGAGRMHDDGVSPGGSSFQNDFQLHLRGRGKAEVPPATIGPERQGDRRLNLKLSFLLGDGRGSAINSGGYAFSVGVSSADLAQLTFTSYPGGNIVTVAGVHDEVTPWTDLRSTSVTREEIAPDVIVETAVYRASRQGTRRALGREVPVTERIEVKHVRYLKLVPRG